MKWNVNCMVYVNSDSMTFILYNFENGTHNSAPERNIMYDLKQHYSF